MADIKRMVEITQKEGKMFLFCFGDGWISGLCFASFLLCLRCFVHTYLIYYALGKHINLPHGKNGHQN